MDDIEPHSFEERQQQIVVNLRRAELNAFIESVITFLFTIPFIIPLYQTWEWLQYGKRESLTFALLYQASFALTVPVTVMRLGLRYRKRSQHRTVGII